jgi:hypothetical protein
MFTMKMGFVFYFWFSDSSEFKISLQIIQNVVD